MSRFCSRANRAPCCVRSFSIWLSAELLQEEVHIMERVSFDRNIVQYYGACLNEEVPLLVMEYMAVRSPLLRRVLFLS